MHHWRSNVVAFRDELNEEYDYEPGLKFFNVAFGLRDSKFKDLREWISIHSNKSVFESSQSSQKIV